jgi:catechol 2,3-dioxygenase-like lactoylglutathione lyase family enzyme
MFGRVTIHAGDLEGSRRFYDTVLAALEMAPTADGSDIVEWHDFALDRADGNVTTGLHVGFVAPSREHVDAFWRAGVEAGYRDDGDPGPRPKYRDDYYGAFLLDCDGNSAEAVHHGALRRGGAIDHLWIRVADVAAARAFYAALAPDADMRLVADLPERATFAGTSGSFSLVAGEPTRNLALVLPARRGVASADPDGNSVALRVASG